ncbi:MAG: uroporphyrinogen decarboxylase family protein [Synergistales bacterium]|nr:uroporphyrinogen decarboxylase family protein [Synergistales bacterium]
MNAMERVLAAVRLEPADRTPVVPQVFGQAGVMNGMPLEAYITSGEAIAEGQMRAQEYYGHDAVFAAMDLGVETEATGSTLRYRRGEYPTVERYAVQAPEQLDVLEPPDPRSSGRMPELLRAASILRRELGDEVPVIGCIAGPLTLASQLMGLEAALYLVMDEPERFEQLHALAAETVRRFGLALLDAGAHGIMLFNPSASPEVVPAQFFREFECPRLRALGEAFRKAGSAALWFNTAGPVESILPLYRGCGADIGNLDYCVAPEDVLAMELDLCVDGNIKPLDFVTATPREIRAAADRLLALFAGRDGFILSSGCEVPPQAPPGNVSAMTGAVLSGGSL